MFFPMLWSEEYLLYTLLGLIMIPAIIFSAIAQGRVSSVFNKYKQIRSSSGKTAYMMARQILDESGIRDVQIVNVSGTLTDHYDPRKKTLALSDSVYNSTSIAALGVAAHEVGHAIQHHRNYLPSKIRAVLVPVVNISSTLMWPLVIIAMIFGFIPIQVGNFYLGDILMVAGIIFFGGTTLFTLITLPTEFNASSRAFKILKSSGALTHEEAKDARKVLNAAALTYVAAFLTAALALLRFVLYILLSRNSKK